MNGSIEDSPLFKHLLDLRARGFFGGPKEQAEEHGRLIQAAVVKQTFLDRIKTPPGQRKVTIGDLPRQVVYSPIGPRSRLTIRDYLERLKRAGCDEKVVLGTCYLLGEGGPALTGLHLPPERSEAQVLKTAERVIRGLLKSPFFNPQLAFPGGPPSAYWQQRTRELERLPDLLNEVRRLMATVAKVGGRKHVDGYRKALAYSLADYIIARCHEGPKWGAVAQLVSWYGKRQVSAAALEQSYKRHRKTLRKAGEDPT